MGEMTDQDVGVMFHAAALLMQKDQKIADLRAKLEQRFSWEACELHARVVHTLKCKYCEIDQAEARVRRLEEALRLAQDAMRAPLDDWKGVVERKALDAARAALEPENPPTC